MAITYSIEFAAAIARLEQGTREGARHVKKMADEMEGAANFARNVLLSLGAALGVHTFARAIKSASDAADAAAKMGDRFGIATEKLIGMQHAGDLAGMSNEGLATALRSMAKSGIDAARGGEEAAKAYGKLGINAAEFVKLPMDQQFSTLIDKLGQVENVALRNALAQDTLGKAAGEAMGLVAEGSGSLQAATQDAMDWGLALSRVDAAKLELANDAMTRAQAATRGIFTTIALQLSPAVTTLANGWADNAAAAKGFKQEAASAAEAIVTGIAYAMNVVQGLRFAYVGVKLAIAEVIDLVAQGANWIVQLGPDSPESRKYAMIAESTRDNAKRIKDELDSIANEGLPAQKLIARFEQIVKTTDQAAVQIAKSRQKMMGGAGEEIDQDKASDKRAPRDTWREQMAQKIERIREESMTELQLLDEKLREKNLILQSAMEAGLIDEETGAAQSAALLKKYDEAKTKITDEETKKRFGIQNVYRQMDLQSTGYFFGQMAGLMNSKSRSMFEIGKVAAIGETVIQTYTAAQGAYASLAQIPIVGPALGIAAAAAAIASGMARVQQIRSTQFGGGAVAAPVYSASPTTGLPTAPIGVTSPQSVAQVEKKEPPKEINVTMIGKIFDTETIRDAMTQIGEQLGYGVNVNFRNA